MIQLQKLNGKSFSLNAIYIEQIQSNPDTTITLTNGKIFIVKDSELEVNRKITEFYCSIKIFGQKDVYSAKE